MNKLILLFDLDNTLLDFDAAEAKALRKSLREFGLEPNDEIVRRYNVINMRHWEMLEEGRLTRPQVLVGRYEMLFEEFGIMLNGADVAKAYEGHLGEEHDFMPGAQALLDELYGKYEMYIVSNGTASVQKSRLRDSGLNRYFKDIFISELIGHDKPSKSFFDACFERIPGFEPENALIIGDSLTSDIKGGLNSGIATCWFNPRGAAAREDIPADYTVSELAELPALFEKLERNIRKKPAER